MTQSEFSLIDHFFKSCPVRRDDVVLGIGDDAAITTVKPGMQLVSAVDTLVNTVHFPEETPPFAVGYKALAVNLSDLAAMGAEPAWATLAITMPRADENWLRQFCEGFFQLAEQFNVQLIGGDTTQGPLTVTVQVTGLLPEGIALKRSGANKGDCLYVSGTLGDAALGLAIQQGKLTCPELSTDQKNLLIKQLNLPVPRVELGAALRTVATAAIDVSDGLAADLKHILHASRVGATLQLQHLPLSSIAQTIKQPVTVYDFALTGGDDYELCFTVSPERRDEVQVIGRQLNIKVTEIGVIDENPGLRILSNGVPIEVTRIGYEHFSNS